MRAEWDLSAHRRNINNRSTLLISHYVTKNLRWSKGTIEIQIDYLFHRVLAKAKEGTFVIDDRVGHISTGAVNQDINSIPTF
jgi:hypothetical protein